MVTSQQITLLQLAVRVTDAAELQITLICSTGIINMTHLLNNIKSIPTEPSTGHVFDVCACMALLIPF
jgi:hypothetical protein